MKLGRFPFCVEGELAHHKTTAAGVLKRVIHLPLVIFEDSHLGDFLDEPLEIGCFVFVFHSEKNEKSVGDFADTASFDVDCGLADSLKNGSHCGELKAMRQFYQELEIPF